MKGSTRCNVIGCVLLLFCLDSNRIGADEVPKEYRSTIAKGLSWIAQQQQRDGHWEANGGQYPTTMTALAGMALLMEGSTLRDGKYAANLRKAVDWLMERSQRNGLIGNPNHLSEAQKYMYGHGFAMLFLACVYGEEEDGERRKKLEEILTRGVEFTGKAQSSYGGWYYLSAADCGDQDEGSVTITQVQALRAARNAGIVVPKTIVDKAQTYLAKSTTDRGGVIYSLGRVGRAAVGGERQALTAAAISCGFNSGEYSSPIVKKWIRFCQQAIPPLGASGGRMGHDEYTHYYYAQALYILGDTGYAKLFPEARPEERLTWSKYRQATFDYLAKAQAADGSWTGTGNWGYIGPVYATAMYLTILQLDDGTLPIYQK
jgi:hypothetical protein